MPVNITEEFVHQLMAQIDFLTKQNSTLTATIAELNQTIKELKEVDKSFRAEIDEIQAALKKG